ncbi:glycoside hydrolase family 16 protein [Niabella insulamsoli]|uniref:glycoside hydrolase family 16 protein n=1 Tax=Niabella insulamsoli TaxID=3144874 RepID=UPI0031FCA88C
MIVFALSAALFISPAAIPDTFSHPINGYELIWADEFNKPGNVDTAVWQFEKGFVRNHELQWYQPQNAWCENGKLIIEAKKEALPNPLYKAGSDDWRKSRAQIQYTSSSINTRKAASWQFGRFEIRAKIVAKPGLWPAIWTLGMSGEWPANGEIDIMEYYKGDILANVATGTGKRYQAKWFTTKKPVSSFNEPNWDQSFHVWRMDWDEHFIRLYVDDLLLNEVNVKDAANPDGKNPFHQPHYLLLNLAIGGDNGGDPSGTAFPSRYEIDYVRVFQKKEIP